MTADVQISNLYISEHGRYRLDLVLDIKKRCYFMVDRVITPGGRLIALPLDQPVEALVRVERLMEGKHTTVFNEKKDDDDTMRQKLSKALTASKGVDLCDMRFAYEPLGDEVLQLAFCYPKLTAPEDKNHAMLHASDADMQRDVRLPPESEVAPKVQNMYRQMGLMKIPAAAKLDELVGRYVFLVEEGAPMEQRHATPAILRRNMDSMSKAVDDQFIVPLVISDCTPIGTVAEFRQRYVIMESTEPPVAEGDPPIPDLLKHVVADARLMLPRSRLGPTTTPSKPVKSPSKPTKPASKPPATSKPRKNAGDDRSDEGEEEEDETREPTSAKKKVAASPKKKKQPAKRRKVALSSSDDDEQGCDDEQENRRKEKLLDQRKQKQAKKQQAKQQQAKQHQAKQQQPKPKPQKKQRRISKTEDVGATDLSVPVPPPPSTKPKKVQASTVLPLLHDMQFEDSSYASLMRPVIQPSDLVNAVSHVVVSSVSVGQTPRIVFVVETPHYIAAHMVAVKKNTSFQDADKIKDYYDMAEGFAEREITATSFLRGFDIIAAQNVPAVIRAVEKAG